uniref:Uncharacterized protein n=1 Tax=Diphylleia rotans TaxID=190327 RepID=A0A146I7C1_9EUKA|nr:hypothetical protein A5449_gp18 [Diphylleia rotans]BAU71462.1 hypothetical protein [Diphylleia rotans]
MYNGYPFIDPKYKIFADHERRKKNRKSKVKGPLLSLGGKKRPSFSLREKEVKKVKGEPLLFPGEKKRPLFSLREKRGRRKKRPLFSLREKRGRRKKRSQKNRTFFSPGWKSYLLFPPLPAFPSATCFYLRHLLFPLGSPFLPSSLIIGWFLT